MTGTGGLLGEIAQALNGAVEGGVKNLALGPLQEALQSMEGLEVDLKILETEGAVLDYSEGLLSSAMNHGGGGNGTISPNAAPRPTSERSNTAPA